MKKSSQDTLPHRQSPPPKLHFEVILPQPDCTKNQAIKIIQTFKYLIQRDSLN